MGGNSSNEGGGSSGGTCSCSGGCGAAPRDWSAPCQHHMQSCRLRSGWAEGSGARHSSLRGLEQLCAALFLQLGAQLTNRCAVAGNTGAAWAALQAAHAGSATAMRPLTLCLDAAALLGDRGGLVVLGERDGLAAAAKHLQRHNHSLSCLPGMDLELPCPGQMSGKAACEASSRLHACSLWVARTARLSPACAT